MQTKEYRTIDRAAERWPSGPWDNEPDKVQWPDPATGLPCLAVRSRRGNWCGYVGVTEGHPLFGKHSRELYEANLDVHGGITFADACAPDGDEAENICHTPDPGEPDHVWWLGFDCHHFMDFTPHCVVEERERGYPFTIDEGASYRTLEYVREQCAHLAQQLKTP